MDHLLYQTPALRIFFFGAGEGQELSIYERNHPLSVFAECFGCFPSHKHTLAVKAWHCYVVRGIFCSSVMQSLLSEPEERNNLVADVWSSNSDEVPSANVNCRVCGEGTEGEKLGGPESLCRCK